MHPLLQPSLLARESLVLVHLNIKSSSFHFAFCHFNQPPCYRTGSRAQQQHHNCSPQCRGHRAFNSTASSSCHHLPIYDQIADIAEVVGNVKCKACLAQQEQVQQLQGPLPLSLLLALRQGAHHWHVSAHAQWML